MITVNDMITFPEIAVIYTILSAVLGAILGSFINCVAWRIIAGESPWKGRSHCAKCNHPLSALDLVPVFSWLFLKGRCRYCGEPVSVRYTITELIMAAYFASVTLAYGVGVQTIALWALGVCLLGLSLVDLDSHRIPNGFIIASIIIWVTYATIGLAMGTLTTQTIIDGLLGGFIIAAVILVVSLIMGNLLKKQAMGGGDIKLFFVVGLYLGIAVSVLNVIVACLVGLVLALATTKKAVDTEAEPANAFPFGPAIAIATWFSLLFGQGIVYAYLGLFFF